MPCTLLGRSLGIANLQRYTLARPSHPRNGTSTCVKPMTLAARLFATPGAACTGGGSVRPRPSSRPPPRRPRPRPSDGPVRRADRHARRVRGANLPTADRGQADHRDRQPGLSRRTSPRTPTAARPLPGSSATRPTARASRAPSPMPSPTQLGFTKDQVAWTYVPFDSSYKPGAKTFDIDINQVSYTPERAAAVDLSDGYYFVNQAVVVAGRQPGREGHDDRRPGRATGSAPRSGRPATQTITDIIKPTAEAERLRHQRRRDRALKAKQIDGIVVDLPTAFYMAGAQLDDKGTVVGQFELPDRRRRRALQRRPGQGQPADRLRQRRDRGADRRRHAGRDHPGVAVRQGVGAGLHAVSPAARASDVSLGGPLVTRRRASGRPSPARRPGLVARRSATALVSTRRRPRRAGLGHRQRARTGRRSSRTSSTARSSGRACPASSRRSGRTSSCSSSPRR